MKLTMMHGMLGASGVAGSSLSVGGMAALRIMLLIESVLRRIAVRSLMRRLIVRLLCRLRGRWRLLRPLAGRLLVVVLEMDGFERSGDDDHVLRNCRHLAEAEDLVEKFEKAANWCWERIESLNVCCIAVAEQQSFLARKSSMHLMCIVSRHLRKI